MVSSVGFEEEAAAAAAAVVGGLVGEDTWSLVIGLRCLEVGLVGCNFAKKLKEVWRVWRVRVVVGERIGVVVVATAMVYLLRKLEGVAVDEFRSFSFPVLGGLERIVHVAASWPIICVKKQIRTRTTTCYSSSM
ncbi:hypothetical protein RJ640_007832 [Escallonia rubra]|uniref:Uncharacterized protein n=1 Tax=Escallonia rubra TaxID=112253 RepID=A0AA88UTZ7_9ASTE|nr:hypothetical protein RJ640_007832 [Escallonia rubra]